MWASHKVVLICLIWEAHNLCPGVCLTAKA